MRLEGDAVCRKIQEKLGYGLLSTATKILWGGEDGNTCADMPFKGVSAQSPA